MDLVIKVISSVWFWIDVLLATSGGLVVYWGLKIEKEAERLLVPADFKPDIFEDVIAPYKAKIERGWRILMTGIVMEVVAALILSVISGLEIASANDQAAKATERVSTNELRVAELEKEAAQLLAVGETAKKSAAQATEEAEKAKTEHEKAETGRLVLQAKVLELEQQAAQTGVNASNALAFSKNALPRRLTNEQKLKLLSLLKNVPKAKFGWNIPPEVADAWGLGTDVGQVMVQAGFECIGADKLFKGVTNHGIAVSTRGSNENPKELINALNAVGLNAHFGIVFGGVAMGDSVAYPNGTLYLEVGFP